MRGRLLSLPIKDRPAQTLLKETIKKVRRKLKASGSGTFAPASERNLKLAEDAGFPSEMIDFYRSYEPYDPDGHGVFESEQHIHIWDIPNVLWTIRNDVPALVVFPLGYFAIAMTRYGDAYCMDANVAGPDGTHPIVLFSPETINENTELSYIQESRLVVASSLEDFLLKFASETLVDEAYFPPKQPRTSTDPT
jgi:hypothetical protein